MLSMISGKNKVFVQFLLHTQKTTKIRVTHKKAGLYLKKQKQMAAVLKSASEICRTIFVNILHFLSLRTKIALARPILEVDL